MSSRSCFFRSCCQLLNKRNKVPGLNTHYKFSCFLASSIFCNAYNHSNFLILIFYLSIIYTKYLYRIIFSLFICIDTVGKNYPNTKHDINRSMPTFDPKLCWNTTCRATWMISSIPYKT